MNIAKIPRYQALAKKLKAKNEYDLLGEILDLISDVIREVSEEHLKLIGGQHAKSN